MRDKLVAADGVVTVIEQDPVDLIVQGVGVDDEVSAGKGQGVVGVENVDAVQGNRENWMIGSPCCSTLAAGDFVFQDEELRCGRGLLRTSRGASGRVVLVRAKRGSCALCSRLGRVWLGSAMRTKSEVVEGRGGGWKQPWV